eukprot:scaffold1943_cov343-Pavlova_lutheri.AAC.8
MHVFHAFMWVGLDPKKKRAPWVQFVFLSPIVSPAPMSKSDFISFQFPSTTPKFLLCDVVHHACGKYEALGHDFSSMHWLEPTSLALILKCTS